MLKSIEQFLYSEVPKLVHKLLDTLLPRRSDFDIVKKLSSDDIQNLPKAPEVFGHDWIHPLFHYKNNTVRAIIWELKYKNNTSMLETMSTMMFEEIMAVMSDIALFDSEARFVLLPIPLSDERRGERGYNQSEYIAKAVWQHDRGQSLLYAPQWFQKVKNTPRQSRTVSREERMRNLDGCFSADERVAGTYIILIDDVVTTGSTLAEARKTLLSAGTKDVFAFTIAH